MAAVIIILVFALLFLILSIFLFFGKGSWLIAGYNTASQEEKEKFDRKRLCRAVSAVCAVCSVMLCAMAYFGYRVESGLMNENGMLPFGLVFTAVIMSSLIAAGVYINKNGKK